MWPGAGATGAALLVLVMHGLALMVQDTTLQLAGCFTSRLCRSCCLLEPRDGGLTGLVNRLSTMLQLSTQLLLHLPDLDEWMDGACFSSQDTRV